MGRHRLQVDSDVVAALSWWAAILAGLGLLGVSVSDELTDGPPRDWTVASVPDTAVSDSQL